jgi:hypothetical protein
MREKVEQLLIHAADDGYLEELRNQARRYTRGQPSCATFMSYLLGEADLLTGIHPWTKTAFGNTTSKGLLEEQQTTKRVTDPMSVQPGDILVTIDDPNDPDDAPEHVTLIVSEPKRQIDKVTAEVIDNQGRYIRNLTPLAAGYTTMAYAIRFVIEPRRPLSKFAAWKAFKAFRTLYNLQSHLEPSERRTLNDLRRAFREIGVK